MSSFLSISSRSVACLTLQDWEDLAEKYKKSKKKQDRDLYETLHENFLPEIVKMFAEKEREDRRRLLMMQPKRASGRLEIKRREQEDKDKELAMKVGKKSCIGGGGGRHSTGVAFAILTQQPWVQFSAFPRIFLDVVAEINRRHF